MPFVSNGIIALVCCFIFITGKAFALPNVYPLYLEKNLNNGEIYSLARKQGGYLWLGTDNGLKRYDGYELQSFVNIPDDDSSIGSNAIGALYIDSDNTLWAGGNELNLYNAEYEKFKRYDVSSGAAIRAISKDYKGVVWFGGEGFGLRGFDPKDETLKYKTLLEEPARFIRAIVNSTVDNTLWVATSDGIFHFNPDTRRAKKYLLPQNAASGSSSLHDLCMTPEGGLWLASHQGIYTFNSATEKFSSLPIGRFAENHEVHTPLRLMCDSKGDVWIGTDQHGVYRYSNEKKQAQHFPPSIGEDYAFPNGAVSEIIEDERGSIWFSVTGKGVFRVSEEFDAFSTIRDGFGQDQVAAQYPVTDIIEDAKGLLWMATEGGGIVKYDPLRKEFERYLKPEEGEHSVHSNFILSLTEDGNGNIWFSTFGGGLGKFDTQEFSFVNYTNALAAQSSSGMEHSDISQVVYDSRGKLLLALKFKGLQVFDLKNGDLDSFFPFGKTGREGEISNYSINKILPDNKGNYWIGGDSGLEYFNFEMQSFSSFGSADIKAVKDLFLDDNNMLWIASSNGLITVDLNSKSIRRQTKLDGLADNYMLSVDRDQKGVFWLGTRGGLNRYEPGSGVFEKFDFYDGFSAYKTNRFAHILSKNGMFYFASESGVTTFDPSVNIKNKFAPKAVIKNMYFHSSDVKQEEGGRQSAAYIQSVEMNFDRSDIAFEFAALNFISPQKNTYRYRLQGYEKSWNEVGGLQRLASYKNLDPGEYTFSVWAANNNGVWSPEAVSVSVFVSAPWWEKLWARLLFLLIALAAVYLAVLAKFKNKVNREKILEQLIKRKTTELRIANDAITKLNQGLEKRVEMRTQELLVEIEERRIAEAKLFHMAFHDALTGLPNRSWLTQHIETLIKHVKSSKVNAFGLLFLDGDRFKQINDIHGHLLGDLLLIAASKRLSSLLENGQQAVRLGGDEFTILVDQVESSEQLVSLSKAVIKAFEKPFLIEQNTIYFKVSVGIVLCDSTYDKTEHVLRDADIAMYAAKDKGKGTYKLFDADMRDQTIELIELENELYKAIKNDDLALFYQPIVDTVTGQPVGFESLLRWRHKSRGFVSPCKFIPIAEENGVILELGSWVIESVFQQIDVWSRELPVETLLPVSINLSAVQLTQPKLIERLDQLFTKYCLGPQFIKFEITETAIMENSKEVSQVLDALRFREIELSIDDFGTGYSSLSYLDKLPVSVLKIDKKFIDDILLEDDNSAKEIVRATISLAHSLRMKVVAEGIEVQEQYDLLNEYQCNFAQGYFISEPLDVTQATQYL